MSHLGTMHFRPVEWDDAGWFEKEWGFEIPLWGGWSVSIDFGLLGWRLRSWFDAWWVVSPRCTMPLLQRRFSHLTAHLCLKFLWLDVMLSKEEPAPFGKRPVVTSYTRSQLPHAPEPDYE